ncbi:MAG: putative selenium-dependent hydroxylase accessory protein YqeC [Chloroflexi bacterium]|nr:putative selenium-dependent hydroxylase accessory protein YqeC [Chloroflexota bacterium]
MNKADLLRALLSLKPTAISVSGAGGKSSFLKFLADNLVAKVVLTTTTHLGFEQSNLARDHVILEPHERIDDNMLAGNTALLITANHDQAGKWQSLREPQLFELSERCRNAGKLLVIESDGSRGKPIKAPAGHEPVIPPFVDLCVYILGLSAVGTPLDTLHAHRPELVAEVTQTNLGDTISLTTFMELLISSRAGLKEVPWLAKRVAILNQLDVSSVTEERVAAFTKALTDIGYRYVWFGSLKDHFH